MLRTTLAPLTFRCQSTHSCSLLAPIRSRGAIDRLMKIPCFIAGMEATVDVPRRFTATNAAERQHRLAFESSFELLGDPLLKEMS
jgi:hypothetical protein